ncbi:terminase large subunit domain-containing protein [Streptomyces sp. NRRL S-455]|uniref:phage terminase large subunit family protein n=1 Tax=Streptomyces sp. NRRL S-455 TaxID=1463908 RepID=UPI000AB1C94B|nr:terminase family protein [Streptomyces sp. NRRL S-455]
MVDRMLSRAAAERLLMHARTLSEPRWTPLPHQVPPEGDWYGWLLLAGRGAGKTDACARYVHEHVMGPPCLPGPTPHWIGIIAPTLGDAATSCYAGPSGLRVHSPEARMMTVQGGTVIRWPNGSEAKLFGADSPGSVERLRSGGNRCVAEGTLVRTEHGERHIETVRPGDRVWTRNGLRTVLEVWDNGVKDVVRYDHGAGFTWLTPDHKVATADGWKPALLVGPLDSVLTWNKTGASEGVISPPRSAAGAARQSGPARSTEVSSVSAAGPPSSPGARSQRGTALRSAVRMRHEHGRNGCAACAATRLSAKSVSRPAPVRAGALRSSRISRAARVYDLTVEHDHEFFAGDLLVSNCLSWLEELAAWRYLDDTWDQMRFGLRTGPRPHWVASTTPKPRALIKKLASGGVENVVRTRASMYDNPHLPEDIKAALEDAYGSTQIGRQELHAEIIDQDENALWTRAVIDAHRLRPADLPDLARISVGVDPSGGRGEQGIVVVGKAMREHVRSDGRPAQLAHGHVLADRSCHLSPDGWGRRAVQAAVDYDADDICVEVNFGGDMAVNTIRAAADAMGVRIPIKTVRATRGKKVRAEPVSALSEQGRWHMVGEFPELEDQMCTWYDELDWSPDRLDAMVWPAWHQRIVKPTMTGTTSSKGLATAARTIG